MKRVIAVCVLSLGLSGCFATGAAVIGTGLTMYCAGTSAAAKEAARDLLTAGQKILECGETD